MRLVFIVFATSCAAAPGSSGKRSAQTSFPIACAAIEHTEQPVVVGEELSYSTLGTHSFELYRNGLIVGKDLPGTSGPLYPARTSHHCLDAATTTSLLAEAAAAAARPLPDAAADPAAAQAPTVCIVPRVLPQLMWTSQGAPLVCAHQHLGELLREAYEHVDAQDRACPKNREMCAIGLTSQYVGMSAHDPATTRWSARLDANGRYRCEVREPGWGGFRVSYPADEGQMSTEQMTTLFAQLLDGISGKTPAAASENEGVAFQGAFLERRVSLILPKAEPGDAAQEGYAVPAGQKRIWQRFSRISKMLGERCVPR